MLRLRPGSLLICLWALVAACESAPLAGSTAAGSGEAVSVELLDAHFVSVDGTRQPWEELVYRMRRECRAARVAETERGDLYQPPWIRFRVAADAALDEIPRDTFDRIASRLREAGVRRIEIAQ